MTGAGSRRTLERDARLHGRGLFTGAECEITVLPRPSGGISFRRTDLPGSPEIPALASHVGTDPRLPGRSTILVADPARPPGSGNPGVMTVEHVLSALAGLGITDATVEVSGPEIPIADGSAAPFVEALEAAGSREMNGAASTIIIRERFSVLSTDHSAEIAAEPSPDGRAHLSYTLDYSAVGGPGASTFAWSGEPGSYTREVAPARTFCLEREAVAMRSMGLFSWITPRDMLVLRDDGRPIDNELRFPDEPARHKLLDLLGDLSLAGAPFIGRLKAARSGHALNAEMARALRRHAGL